MTLWRFLRRPKTNGAERVGAVCTMKSVGTPPLAPTTVPHLRHLDLWVSPGEERRRDHRART
jgi:hypothetical protein